MPRVDAYIVASLVSATLILASGPGYTQICLPQDTAHNDKRGQPAYECQTSSRRIAYLNSVEDFCLWAPSHPESATKNTQRTLTAWCMKSANATHLIPSETISWARFLKTPEYIQITGVGNLTNINALVDGVATVSGKGDREPGLVFTSAYGQLEQIYYWTSFMSQERFCFRACNPTAAPTACSPIYDASGCTEIVIGNDDTRVLEDCVGDVIEAPSTLYQEVLAASSHNSAFPPSGCTTHGVGNARLTRVRRTMASASSSNSSALLTSFSLSHSQSLNHSTQLTTSIMTTSTGTNTTITSPPFPIPTSNVTAHPNTTIAPPFPTPTLNATAHINTTIIYPSFPTSTLNVTALMNSTTPLQSPTLTFTSHSFNHTHTQSHWHSCPHHHFCPSSISVSSLSSLSTSSTSSHASLTLTSFTSSPGTSTPRVTPIPTTTSTISTSSFPTSYSSSSDPSQPPSYSSSPTSPASSTAHLSTSSTTPPATSPSTSSQSSDILMSSTSQSPSSVLTTSPTTSSPAFPNSATQLGSQCPPSSRIAMNAASASITLPLIRTVLMPVLLSCVGVFAL